MRAKSRQEARERLWNSLQLHFEFPEFYEFLNTRMRIFLGDLTTSASDFADDEYHALVDTTDSVIHCAASLNRKSEKQCLNVNLRGTLEVIQLTRRAQNHHGLAALFACFDRGGCGAASGRSGYGRYGDRLGAFGLRSLRAHKKFCEHMAVSCCRMCSGQFFVRRSSWATAARPETTQFDMVQAFDILSRFPVLPLRGEDRIDIVPANYVGDGDRGDSSEGGAGARHLSSFVGHRFADVS